MSLISPPARLLWTLAFILAACSADGRDVEDVEAIHGCYVAEGAPLFSLSGSGMQVEGASTPVRFHYEFAKVGYGILVRLEARRLNGRLAFVPSAEDYFYRRASASNPPTFIVAFGPQVVTYRRTGAEHCQS